MYDKQASLQRSRTHTVCPRHSLGCSNGAAFGVEGIPRGLLRQLGLLPDWDFSSAARSSFKGLAAVRKGETPEKRRGSLANQDLTGTAFRVRS